MADVGVTDCKTLFSGRLHDGLLIVSAEVVAVTGVLPLTSINIDEWLRRANTGRNIRSERRNICSVLVNL